MLFNKLILFLKKHKIHEYKQIFNEYGNGGLSLYALLKRQNIKSFNIFKICLGKEYDKIVCDKIDINIKFEGYIKNQLVNIRKLSHLSKTKLNMIKDYKNVPNLSLEAIDKLNKIKPLNLAQAKRISGINLIDIAIIKNYITNLITKNE